MSYCTNCGTKLADGAKFCIECGHRIENHTAPSIDETPAVDVSHTDSVFSVQSEAVSGSVPAVSAASAIVSPAPVRVKRSAGRRIAGLIFILLVIALGVFVSFQKKTSEPSEVLDISQNNSSIIPNAPEVLTGNYRLNSFTTGENSFSSQVLEMLDYDDCYIQLEDNGRGHADILGMKFEITDARDGKITLSNGSVIPYTVDGNELKIQYVSCSLVFNKVPLSATNDNSTDSPLCLPSDYETFWSGTITAVSADGEATERDDSQIMDCWAILGTDSGRNFFEIYDNSELDGSSLFSSWVNVYSDRIVLDPPKEDAWLFDKYLAEEDCSLLVFLLSGDNIKASYLYNDSESAYQLEFEFNKMSE